MALYGGVACGLSGPVTQEGAWPCPGRGVARAAAAAMAAAGDWQDFSEFRAPEAGAGAAPGGGFSALTRSLEEKLRLCFHPPGPGAETPRAAVRPITERSLLQGDE